ncbi:hypothetical protein NE237_026202 [Protea cynaroides]|uniref:Tetraspanin n=1 Tax=Protea cynaroides TaxID=273540 RepID=A0A9Q0H3B5_9MAGN|nr:hypothetical protein NE237_026202 [Protea cynaroides]
MMWVDGLPFIDTGASITMADAVKFPGIAFIAIIDGLLAFILCIILFNVTTYCWSLQYWWITILEVSFIFVSTIGMLAAFVGSQQILLIYFLMELILTVVFTIFVIASWNVGEGNWAQLKDCMHKAEFCQDEVSAKLFKPIFIACCKEPASCNTSSKNSSLYNPNCHLWNTDSAILCYDCRSCMDAILGDFKLSGKFSAILSTIFLVIFLSLFITQVFLYRKGQEQQQLRRIAAVQPTQGFGGVRSSTRVAPSPNQS